MSGREEGALSLRLTMSGGEEGALSLWLAMSGGEEGALSLWLAMSGGNTDSVACDVYPLATPSLVPHWQFSSHTCLTPCKIRSKHGTEFTVYSNVQTPC